MMFQTVGFLIFFFCIFTSSIHGVTDPADASVLNGMYTTLNQPYQLTKWVSNGGDPCGESWKGVKCAGSDVTEIDLSGLGLSGTVGFQLANLKSLTNLDISHNSFGNQLPYALPPNLQRLNIAGNGFTGGLPYSISQITSLKYINASHNQFKDQLNDMYSALSALSSFYVIGGSLNVPRPLSPSGCFNDRCHFWDFSFNVIQGILPQSFSSLSSLNTLNLNNNQFTGNIDVLANLPLTKLNVASNLFSGWIPERLKKIIEKDGNSFSSGPAPPPPPGTPPASPTPKPGNKSNPSADGGSSKKSGVGTGVIAGIVISILAVGAVIAFFLLKRRSRKATSEEEKLDNQPLAPLAPNVVLEIKPVQTASAISTKTYETPAIINLRPPPNKSFDEDDVTMKPIVPKKANTAPIDVKSYSIADLQMATSSFNFDTLIGEGSFGRVYRAQFDDGKVLAVKKIDTSILSDSDDFTEVVSKISRLHHPNIDKLVGYCSEHGQYLLVLEFHKIGSLHDFLHLPEEYSKPLIWNTRVKISLGTARALEYLHEVCSPSVVYKNFKSANILLGTELNPQLTDCGLASFLPNADQALVHDGYSAPEVVMSGQYNLKSDVYSFGVVMLELLTGRKPFDSSRPRAEQSLVRWSTPQLHDIDALAKMVDPALKGLYPVKSLSRFADVIAICVQSEPEFRPPMSEVVQALVLLVERANMSKRTVGNDQGASQ